MFGIFGRFLGKLAFPAQLINKRHVLHYRDAQLKEEVQRSFDIQATTFTISDKGHSRSLDAIAVIPESFNNFLYAKRSFKDAPAVLLLNGYDSCYEEYMTMLYQYANEFQIPFYSFNYRGVVRSTGTPTSANDLVEDAIAAVKEMIRRGHPKDKIVLLGHSLGGGIGALAAQALAKEGIHVKFYADRTFASFTRAALGMKTKPGFVFGLMFASLSLPAVGLWFAGLATASTLALSVAAISLASSVMTKIAPNFMKKLLKPLFWLVVNLGGWEINTIDAFKSLPEKDKAYTIVKSPEKDSEKTRWDGRLVHISGDTDNFVTECASLHQGLKAQELHSKAPKAPENLFTPGWSHLRHDVKLVKAPNSKTEQTAHSTNLHEMQCRYSGMTGLKHFQHFIEHSTDTKIGDKIKDDFIIDVAFQQQLDRSLGRAHRPNKS